MVSVAWRVTDSAAVSVMVKVVCPLASVVAGEGPEMCAEHDAVQAKVTALPATGTGPSRAASRSRVEWSTPSAVTVVGEATTVDWLAAGAAALPVGPSRRPAGVPLSESLGAM